MSDIDRETFLDNRRATEQRFFENGFRFAGHLLPPDIVRQSHEVQQQRYEEKYGDSLEYLGDVISSYSTDPIDRELLYLPGYVVVYTNAPLAEI